MTYGHRCVSWTDWAFNTRGPDLQVLCYSNNTLDKDGFGGVYDSVSRQLVELGVLY
jgi:hypothetical protein